MILIDLQTALDTIHHNILSAVDFVLFLNPNDTCLLFQHKDLERIEQVLTKNFSNICDW